MSSTLFWVAIGGLYFVVTMLLFLFGANLMMLSWTMWRRGPIRPAGSRDAADSGLPMVTVQLPIFNELYVARRVIESACAMDYPRELLEIQVLDDSTDESTAIIAEVVAEIRAEGHNVVHLHRADRAGYKAGALADGLGTATGSLVAIFDADFICPPNFLREVVGHFDDESLAFVQTRWGHTNRGYSWMTRLQSLAIDGHFMVEQAARGELGYWFNFNGTAGIWRVAAIEDAGGWTADTLTEDLDLSYRAHLRGWHGHYRGDIEVLGELPVQMSSFRRQQHRWARGSLECAYKLLPQVWRSDAGVATKLQATSHLLAYGVHFLLFLLALMYPFVVAAGERYPSLSTLYGIGFVFALSSFAPGIFFVTGQRQLSRAWWREIPRIVAVTLLGSGLMVNTLRAAVQIATDRNPEFERTAKFGLANVAGAGAPVALRRYQLDFDRIVYSEAALGLYSAFAAVLAWRVGNWGVFIYATVFSLGLLAVVVVTVGQALEIHMSRIARAESVEAEMTAWSASEPTTLVSR